MMISGATVTARRTGGPELAAPAATRVRPARWRNPQLLVGGLLVLVSVVVGARVVAAADDTVPVLVAGVDLSPGQPLTADLVETRQVGIADAGQYYLTDRPGGAQVVVREVHAGELLPRSAVAESAELAAGNRALRFVTLAVPIAEAPAGLAAGHAVDVWLTPDGDGDDDAQRLAAGLTVTNADTGGSLGLNGSQATVTLAVRAKSRDALDELVGRLIASSRAGRVYLATVPGAGR